MLCRPGRVHFEAEAEILERLHVRGNRGSRKRARAVLNRPAKERGGVAQLWCVASNKDAAALLGVRAPLSLTQSSYLGAHGRSLRSRLTFSEPR